ncbi:MAG TPA: YceI family protein [Steroidobacteraceae bacterium]|nr:YceI family protein [Steroidobacteraceae bacterium]
MRRSALATALVLAATAPLAFADTAPASVAPVPKGAYTMDKAHTSLIFRVNHLGFSSFTGRFTRLDARLETDPSNLTASKLNVTIDPASVETDNAPEGFLDMVRGKGWLETADFPEMKFRSTRVEVTAANQIRVQGELTFHGVTRPIVLDAKYNGGYAGHPMDPHARIGFSATGKFKRSDFGVTVGIPAPGTTMGVGDEVEIVLETELSGPALAVAKN